MATLDTKKFEELLEAGKPEEASAFLKTYFDNLSEEERGSLYVDFALMYMKAMNAVNERQKNYLKGLLEKLQRIDKAEHQTVDALKLAGARADLA